MGHRLPQSSSQPLDEVVQPGQSILAALLSYVGGGPLFICALYWTAGVLAWSFLTCASALIVVRKLAARAPGGELELELSKLTVKSEKVDDIVYKYV